MTFSSDHILDRIRLKRRLRIWQGIGVLAVVSALVAIGARLDIFGHQDHIARLWVEGVIQDDIERDELIAELGDDDSVKAVIVRINSPGGTVVGGEALYKNLRSLASKKPVVAVMGEVAASAGYMTAIAADHIVAREGTITGSIGVLMQSVNVTGLLDKVGVKPIVVKSAPLKAAPNPLEEVTPEALKATEVVILDMYHMFLGMVAERRNLAIDDARKLADGRIFTGRQAKQAGLVDETGSESQAIKWLQDEKKVTKGLEVFDALYGEEEFWGHAESALIRSFFDKTLISEGLRLDGLVSVWQPNLQ
ncbi:signal peptide peptidase SppA [Terasakiella sp. A23]|uniref:signal peptide peptidase SppA n=1 Tax=Terasakiella sp. FCG-A23 TaxID=3080561 RepID=UPI0029552D08|nr:signal peptide peptidase SppA [Terasakiella sp. A23]MDV7339939.1 signal peptide peptidase SppA [Terasakiella sp. A23]